MKIQAINGFKDILPEEVGYWQRLETTARDIFSRFCFEEIRLPILEKTELFARSIGEATDIVEKEMYTFPDKGLTMRPEATASLLRSFIENGMHVRQPVQRLFTIGPMFRHERPQKGRLRQFHQIDVEVIGSNEPQTDAELMAMGQLLLRELGLTASLEINSLGCPVCRPSFRKELVNYLQERIKGLCPDCARRIAVNPLRALDCKNPNCHKLVQESPSLLDYLCTECGDHFETTRSSLDALGVSYTVNRFMVRGLDYYTKTTFEFLTNNLGAQAAVGAGGRYDGLIEHLGGPGLPGIGFAMGMERLVLLLQQQEQSNPVARTDIFIAALGEEAGKKCLPVVHQLRIAGLKAAMDYGNRSLKAQMKLAGRLNSEYTLIVGDKEIAENSGVLRNMRTQQQETLPLDGQPSALCARLLEHLRGEHDNTDLFQSITL